MRSLLLFSLLSIGVANGQGIITTVAGGTRAYPAGGMPALSADIGVRAIAAGPDGSIYVSDTDRHLVFKVSPDGMLNTVAGNGLPGYSGDGGPAVNASLNYPVGLAVDAAGSLYIADSFNHRIRKVGADGFIATVAGGRDGFSGDGGPATRAGLLTPNGVAVDAAGALYIADSDSHRVRKVSADGTITTVAGNGSDSSSGDGGPATSAGLGSPDAIAVDAAGTLYILDSVTYSVRKVSSDGTISTVAGNGSPDSSGDGGLATNAGLDASEALAVDGAGILYIADTNNGRIRKVGADGIITTAASGSLRFPSGVTVNSSGALFVADTGNNLLRKVNQDGSLATLAGNGSNSYSGDGGPATSASLDYPNEVAVDASGALYIADNANNRIRKVNAAGIITTVAGNAANGYSGDGGQAASASLSSPHGVAVDAAGSIYIADTGNHRIRKVGTDGVITTVAGNGAKSFSGDSGPAVQASLNNPYRVALDAAGSLYIVDSGNKRIRRVSLDGTITTVAGNGNSGFSGDGGPAISASLNNPLGVAVDASGILYVADTGNNRIRRVGLDGVISTVAGTDSGVYSDDSGATGVSLSAPYDVAVDSAGAFYIADTFNRLIRKVTPAGIITTVAGNGSSLNTGDGGPATSAGLGNPVGITIDGAGSLYIADNFTNRVRKVSPPAAYALAVSPTEFTLHATAGAGPLGLATLRLTASGASIGFQASASASWLMLSSPFGETPATIQLQVDASKLSTGSHFASIIITAPTLGDNETVIPVTLTVDATLPAQLGLGSEPLRFTVPSSASRVSKILPLVNSGGGTLAYTAKTDRPWLAVNPASGNITSTQPVSLQVTVTPGALDSGSYAGNVQVNDSIVPVLLTVAADGHKLLVSQTALHFTAVAGGGAPLPQTFGVLNGGQGSMDWRAESSAPWLKLTPSNGTAQRPILDASLVEASVDPASLAAGEYYGQIRIRDDAASNSPQLITVVFNVLPSGSALPLEVRPGRLLFAGQQGESPGSQEVRIASAAGPVTFSVNGQVGSGLANWLQYLPGNGAATPALQSRVVVQTDFSALLPGAHRGQVDLLFRDLGVSVPVDVLTVVGQQGAASCLPLQLIYSGAQQDLADSPGHAASIEVRAADSCGKFLASDSGVVSGEVLSTQERLTFVSIGNGRWQTNWTAPFTVGDSTRIQVIASTLDGGKSSVALPLALTHPNGGSSPSVLPNGVLNSAGGVAMRVAPGSLVSIYGSQFADGTASASSLPLATTLGNIQAQLGGQLLPLLYVSPGQINAQIPFDAPLNVDLPLVVQKGQQLSPPVMLTIAPAAPGLFLNALGAALVVNASQSNATVTPDAPAQAGDVLIFYGTGFGPVQGGAPNGDAAPGAVAATTPVGVTIGGQAATVAYAGLTPGMVGLYQLNVVVPASAGTGDAVPVVVTQGGVDTRGTVALK